MTDEAQVAGFLKADAVLGPWRRASHGGGLGGGRFHGFGQHASLSPRWGVLGRAGGHRVGTRRAFNSWLAESSRRKWQGEATPCDGVPRGRCLSRTGRGEGEQQS